MFWLLVAGLILVVSAIALAPLYWARAGASSRPLSEKEGAVAFYRAQLEEVDRDIEVGAIAPEQAEIVRSEAARRLLAANRSPDAAPAPSDHLRLVFAALALGAIALWATLVYKGIGRPDLPDQPIASRPAPLMDELTKALAQAEEHLAKNPDDAKTWAALAPVYMKMGRFDAAANAFQQLLRLQGESPALLTDYAEAEIFKQQGVVDAQARQALTKAGELAPKNEKTRYYLGLVALQAGDRAQARKIWTALIEDVGPQSALGRGLSARMAELDPDSGPSPAQALRDKSPQDQQDAIQGMVKNLAAKLAQDGSDREGWLRLIRSYVVLGQREDAMTALQSARKSLAGDEQAQTALADLARALKLEQ